MRRRFAVIVFGTLLLAGCLPGGLIMPVPIGHIDQPWISGVITSGGEPLAGVEVLAKHSSSFFDPCKNPDTTIITDSMGRFEFPGKKSSWTIIWTVYDHHMGICVTEGGQDKFWMIKITVDTGVPSFRRLPKHLELACDLQNAEDEFCDAEELSVFPGSS